MNLHFRQLGFFVSVPFNVPSIMNDTAKLSFEHPAQPKLHPSVMDIDRILSRSLSFAQDSLLLYAVC